MKLKLNPKIILAFALTFFSVNLFSQDQLSVNLQFHHGRIGIDLEGLKVDPFGETTYSVKYGNDFLLGIGFNYFLDKKQKFSFSGAILWNYYSFQRAEESSYTFDFVGLPVTNFYEMDNQNYQAHSILLPMKFNKHFRRLSFSLGLAPRIRLQTRMTFDYFRETIPMSGVSTSVFSQYQFDAGDDYPVPSGLSSIPFGLNGKANLEYRIDLQYLLGLNYHVNSQFAINIEFRDLLLENKLTLYGNEIANPNSGTISFGVSWKILKIK